MQHIPVVVELFFCEACFLRLDQITGSRAAGFRRLDRPNGQADGWLANACPLSVIDSRASATGTAATPFARAGKLTGDIPRKTMQLDAKRRFLPNSWNCLFVRILDTSLRNVVDLRWQCCHQTAR
jgi:hypothetical protein